MAESWSAKSRRLDREREEERRHRARRRRLDPARMTRRALRRHLRRLSGPARRKLKRELRKQKYKATRKTFGQCPTCGRANGPGHYCRQRFTERNAENLRKRLDKRGMPENPNLWKGRRAA